MNSIKYLCNGNPDRIPKIGSIIKIQEHLNFRVEAYGESLEVKEPMYDTGTTYEIELLGVFIIPAGSPVEFLEKFLGV